MMPWWTEPPQALAILLGGDAEALSDANPIQGELQVQLMATLWRLQVGTVEQIRTALPSRYQGAYTTVQTVLNRLVERGLVSREKVGKGFEYRPVVSEEEYVSRFIARTLASASTDARRGALARLIGNLDADEISELQRLAADVDRTRKRRK
jgi:predicted transcriptional regulator